MFFPPDIGGQVVRMKPACIIAQIFVLEIQHACERAQEFLVPKTFLAHFFSFFSHQRSFLNMSPPKLADSKVEWTKQNPCSDLLLGSGFEYF